MINIRRGLDLPIAGKPEQVIHDGPAIRSVALVGFDYVGMKPTMSVAEGDRVRQGQLLFTDKKTPGVKYTAPASGVVSAINRGERRVFQSIVIDVDGDDAETFEQHSVDSLASISREVVVDNLVNSGLWTTLRTRPYSKVPAVDAVPASIFVSTLDTNPLAADAAVIIAERSDDFINGLTILSRLTEGRVNVCGVDVGLPQIAGVEFHPVTGPHPAGLVGTHIHFIDPVNAQKTVWSVGYQDVMAIGALFTTGRIDNTRVVSLAGPQVLQPRLVRTVVGASLKELVDGCLKDGENRIISGSVFAGRKARGALAYLGRYHTQVSVIAEGRERPFLHYMRLGANRFSSMPVYLANASGGEFAMTSSKNGSERAMVPIGAYEKIMPLDILPTQLLRSLIVGDTEMAQKLGCLELDEEDLGLCTYVCVGKYEYGPILRENLTRIEKEG